MSWVYLDKQLTEDDIPATAIGFVYAITCTANSMKYIGKKLLTKAAYKTVNGKKKKCRKTSDWENYFSSCTELKDDVIKFGKDKFHREIICFCLSQATLTYSEEKCQYLTECLERADYYNGNIGCRKYKRNIFQKADTSNLSNWLRKK